MGSLTAGNLWLRIIALQVVRLLRNLYFSNAFTTTLYGLMDLQSTVFVSNVDSISMLKHLLQKAAA